MTAVDFSALEQELTPGSLTRDPDIVSAYAEDRAVFCETGTAAALVRATCVEDVSATLRFANERGIPVVPQGARTGLSGGANAVDGCILLSVEKMNRILEVDEVEHTVTVQPGVINQDLKDHLKGFGLSYPPDPGSVAISSVGGNVATNAGGLCCVKYGVTEDYVRGMTVVLADGSVTHLGRRTKKGVAGFDLASLFIGSEGCLGVIVEIVFELVPALPDPITGIALFPSSRAAAKTVCDFMATGSRPNLLEFIDAASIAQLNAFGNFGLPDGVGAMLIVQADGDGSIEKAVEALDAFERIATECGAFDVTVSDDPADSEHFIAARRAIGPSARKFCEENNYGELVDDVCVPRARLEEFFVRMEAIAAEHDTMVRVAGHAGDGNMHPCVFFNRAEDGAAERAHAAFDAIMAAGLELGGTITGEHGVGYLKRKWLAEELSPVAARMHIAVKSALDPKGILNPGKMLETVEAVVAGEGL